MVSRPTVTFYFVTTIHGTHAVDSKATAQREARALDTPKSPTSWGAVVYRWSPSRKKYKFVESLRGSTRHHDKLSEDISNAYEKAEYYSEPVLWSDGVSLEFKKPKRPYKPPPKEVAPQASVLVVYLVTPDGVRVLPFGSTMNEAQRELQRLARLEIPAMARTAFYELRPPHSQYRLKGGIGAFNYESLEDFEGDPRGVYERMQKALARYSEPATWFDGKKITFKAQRIATARKASVQKSRPSVASALVRATSIKTKPCKPGFAEGYKIMLTGSLVKAGGVGDPKLTQNLRQFFECDWGDVPALIAKQNNARTHSLGGVIRGRYAHRKLGDVHITLSPRLRKIYVHPPDQGPLR